MKLLQPGGPSACGGGLSVLPGYHHGDDLDNVDDGDDDGDDDDVNDDDDDGGDDGGEEDEEQVIFSSRCW